MGESSQAEESPSPDVVRPGRLRRAFSAVAGRLFPTIPTTPGGDVRRETKPSFAATLSILSLFISLATAFFAYSQLRLANEAQLTPFRMTLFTAKLESYKIISSQARGVVAASAVNGALEFNLGGIWVAWTKQDEFSEDILAFRRAHVAEIEEELESVKPVFEKALPLLSENSVVWGGDQLRMITAFRDIVERDLACFEAVEAILKADPDDEHLQPLDGASWGFTEDLCKGLEKDGGRLTVIAREMEQAMRSDLRADRLQMVPRLENLQPD